MNNGITIYSYDMKNKSINTKYRVFLFKNIISLLSN
jgi:hypothetical protein